MVFRAPLELTEYAEKAFFLCRELPTKKKSCSGEAQVPYGESVLLRFTINIFLRDLCALCERHSVIWLLILRPFIQLSPHLLLNRLIHHPVHILAQFLTEFLSHPLHPFRHALRVFFIQIAPFGWIC